MIHNMITSEANFSASDMHQLHRLQICPTPTAPLHGEAVQVQVSGGEAAGVQPLGVQSVVLSSWALGG